MPNILQYIQQLRKQKSKGIALLIDPDKVSEESIKQLGKVHRQYPVNLLFVGGSILTRKPPQHLIENLRKEFAVPIVLFPGSNSQIDPHADALLFLSLISGRNPELLIGKHVEVAALLKKSNLEVIATGYMLIESGKMTTVQYMSGTLPIPHDKPEVAQSTAMAGEMLGLKLIYMDAGSGAHKPVSSQMIQMVRESIDIPVIVGGGIRDAATAKSAFDAGADLIVVGTAVEDQGGKILEEIHQLKLF